MRQYDNGIRPSLPNVPHALFHANAQRCTIAGPEHVPKYHEWMKDAALLEATGSEPLSYDKEVEMQRDWKDDPEKCTFIVLANDDSEGKGGDGNDRRMSFSVVDHLASMVGDVNLFLSEVEVEEQEEEATEDGGDLNNNRNSSSNNNTATPRIQAEVDIMIAEQSHQRHGIGTRATCTMLVYGASHLKVERYFCKINDDNEGSIRLFEAKLGFRRCAYAACFRQIEMELWVKGKPDGGSDAEDASKMAWERIQEYGRYMPVPCKEAEED